MVLFSDFFKKKISRLLAGTSADSKIGIWNWNITKDKFDINRFWFDKLGYRNNIITNLKTLFPIVHTDDLDKLKDGIKSFTELSDTHKNDIDIEFRVRKSDGSWFWIFISGTVTKYRGTAPAFAEGIILDITRQKLVESELQNKNTEIEA